MTKTSQTSIWLKFIAILWFVWILIDYWFKHPLYARSVSESFAGVAAIHLIIGVVAFAVIKRWSDRGLRPWQLVILFLTFLWGGTLVNLTMYSTVSFTGSSILLYLGRSLLFVAFVIWLIWSAYLVGELLMRKVFASDGSHSSVISIAAGLCSYMAAIFILLVAHIFSMWTAIIVFAIPAVIPGKKWPSQLKSFNQPLQGLEKISSTAIVCIILLMLINAITFGYTLSPFPVGFDALNYYINLPKLLADSPHLLKGFQPYNWSLIQAGGVALSGRIEMALILSWIGLVLIQWGAFRIGTRLMKLPAAGALVAVVLFSYMPSVTTQASQELKVDLGLTFMLTALVMSTFHLLNKINTESSKNDLIRSSLLVGLIGGFALGIKLTAVVALFAVVAIIWYKRLGKNGLFGVFLIAFGFIFLGQMDTKSGLRFYHDSVAWLQFLAPVAGMVFLFFAFREDRSRFLKVSVLTVWMIVGAAGAFTPWVLKNLIEIKTPTFTELINGSSHGPIFNIRTFDKNLEQFEEE